MANKNNDFLYKIQIKSIDLKLIFTILKAKIYLQRIHYSINN